MSDDYVCTLDEASLKVAKDELGEDPANRLGAVDTLRTWINQQKHIKFTTDTRILLAYLRYAKFSQLKARKAIENYCRYKTEHPSWFGGFNVFDKETINFIKLGFFFPLPGVDDKGRKSCIYRAAAFDPAEWKSKKPEMMRAMYCISFFMIRDEQTQVNGLAFLDDMTGLTMQHSTFWSIEEAKRSMKFWQETVPGRFKGFYQYNCGPLWEVMMALFMPFLSKKFKERIIMCGNNLEDVYKLFPKENLPSEYLPDDYKGPHAGTIDQLTDTTILLAYLRYAKFSQLKARKAIENYCRFKTEQPSWFNNFDAFDEDTIKLTKTGFFFPLPGYDEKGRKRCIYRAAAFDPAEWKSKKPQMVRAMYCASFCLIRDEMTQVNGMVFLEDMTNLTLAHQTFWSLEEIKRTVKFWQDTCPGRFKGFYQYNCGPIWEAMMALFMPFLSKKFRERMIVCGNNLADVYKLFPKEVLPSEYLPDDYKGPHAGTIDQLSDEFLRAMQEPKAAEYCMTISHPDWKMDKSITVDDVPSESFRKLNVD